MSTFHIFLEITIVLLTIIGPVYYMWLTLQGTVVPHRMTYFFWFLAQAIAVTASLAQGVAFLSQFVVTLSSVMCLLIFISSFYQRDSIVWKFTKFDWVCAIFSAAGIVLWKITDIPNLTIGFAILADLVITLPTLVKSFSFPETESTVSYFSYLVANILTLLFFTHEYNFQTLAMPIYLVINILSIIGCIVLGRYAYQQKDSSVKRTLQF